MSDSSWDKLAYVLSSAMVVGTYVCFDRLSPLHVAVGMVIMFVFGISIWRKS